MPDTAVVSVRRWAVLRVTGVRAVRRAAPVSTVVGVTPSRAPVTALRATTGPPVLCPARRGPGARAAVSPVSVGRGWPVTTSLASVLPVPREDTASSAAASVPVTRRELSSALTWTVAATARVTGLVVTATNTAPSGCRTRLATPQPWTTGTVSVPMISTPVTRCGAVSARRAKTAASRCWTPPSGSRPTRTSTPARPATPPSSPSPCSSSPWSPSSSSSSTTGDG